MSTNQSVTGWELPQLLRPMHQPKKEHRSRDSIKVRPHFMPIVAYVYRNRYVTINQVQRGFSDVLKSERTARRHVSELESLGYLAPVTTRAVSPNFPKVLHVLLTTEFMLNVWRTTEASDNLELCQIERRSLARQPAFEVAFGHRLTRVEPDAMFVHREQGRGLMVSLVELDTGSMRLQQMTAKFARYEAWASSDAGQDFLLELWSQARGVPVFVCWRLLPTTAGG